MVMYDTKEKPELELGDNASEQGFCAFFYKLTPTPTGSVRLFDRQGWYSAHGSDALYVANHVYRTQTVLKFLGKPTTANPQGLPSCTLSLATAHAFLRDALTAKQLRIELYEPDGKGASNLNKFRIAATASPGNLGQVEELLFSRADIYEAPVIMSLQLVVKDGVKTVGIAFADTSMQELGVTEFIDNDLFSNTESLLIQLGVKEVLLPSDGKASDYDLSKIRGLIERCNIVVTDRRKSEFTAKNIEQDLNRLLSSDLQAVTLPEFDMKVAMVSISALISYLALMNDTSNYGQYVLRHHDLSQYMKLDASALRALNLMPDPTALGGSNKTTSLYGLLNRNKTSQGQRLLNQWLKQPSVVLHEILRRQDLVECFYQDQTLHQGVSGKLKLMPDLHRISKRLQKGSASLEDVVRLYQCCQQLPGLADIVSEGGEGNERWTELLEETYVTELRASSTKLTPFETMVETTIDLDEVSQHKFVIKPEFDETLQELQEQLEGIKASLDSIHHTVAKDLHFETDNKVLHFEQNATYGYCFRLTRKEGSVIKNKTTYVELSNKSNGVNFTTKELKRVNENYKETSAEYSKKQSALVKEVISIAASYCTVLESTNNVLAHLDVIASLADASMRAPTPYVKPEIFAQGEGALVLEGARHPCLEVQDGIDFIPNDVMFERDTNEFHIITGANMGGKSTFIRQVGVIALMAQIGCFVPCTSARVPIFDSILCRVGAGDSYLKGVSTFMAEMLETAAILKTATKDSLIIIDELGRGTSTYDGFGLAWAISEHISTEIRAFCLFATHFHELTSLSAQTAHVKNYHVMAHVEDKPDSITGKEITFLYKINPGVCDQSFGIHVAELANFPEEVIKLAKRKADDLEDFSENPSAVSISSGLSPEEIEAGTTLVEEFLAAYGTAIEHLSKTNGDEDIEMTGADEMELEEVKILKEVYASFKDRLDASEWSQKVLAQTY